MPLTKEDLHAIQEVMQQTIEKSINESEKTMLDEMNNKLSTIKTDIQEIKETNEVILDEVERVHEIFEKNYNELNKKIS